MKKLPAELDSIAWAAYRSLLSDAECIFGGREAGFIVTQIMQDPTGPEMRIDGSSITLVVGPNAVAYTPTLISNIAHEVVHTLNPRSGNANRLEEGIAVHFELGVIQQRYGDDEREKFWASLPVIYRNALADFERLYEFDDNPAFSIRSGLGSFSVVTAEKLQEMYTEMPNDLAFRLADRQRMRPDAG